MDDELYVKFDAKVATTSNNNPTIAPPIAWRGLRYLSAKTVPWPPVRVHNVRFGSKADITWSYRNVPFYLRERTYTGGIGMSALCQ